MLDSKPIPAAPSPGSSVGRYRLLRKLGQGGMGAVYEAEHTRLRKRVALKVLSPRLAVDAEASRRFEREMTAVGRVSHPGIVQALDADEAGGVAYLAMELVDGSDVSRVAAGYEAEASRPLPHAIGCEIVRQAAAAMQAAHEAGLIHRDIKPSNLMIGRDGVVKVLDLGLAIVGANGDEASAALTSTGQIMGTVDYMAPEQAAGASRVDARADVYALSATLYRLLTGSPPYPGDDYPSLLYKLSALANVTPPPVRELRADVPRGLSDLVADGMSRDPSGRPPSASALAGSLGRYARGDLLAELARGLAEPGVASSGASGRPAFSTATASAAAGVAAQAGRPAEVPTVISGGASDPGEDPARRVGSGGRRGGRGVRIGLLAGGAAAAVLGILLLLRTDKGVVRVEVPDGFEDRVTVTVKRDGGMPRDWTIDADDRSKSLTVGTGDIELVVSDADRARYVLTPSRFVLTDDGTQLVKVTRLPAAKTAGKTRGAASGGGEAAGLSFAGTDRLLYTEPLPIDPAEPLTFELTFSLPAGTHARTDSVVPIEVGRLRLDLFENLWKVAAHEWSDAVRGGAMTGTHPPDPGTHHVAGQWTGETLEMYWDGELVEDGPYTFGSGKGEELTADFIRARLSSGGDVRLCLGGLGGDVFDGVIRQVRVTRGVRYTENFTPPDPFETDDQTLVRYDFTAAGGSVTEVEAADDLSGNGFHASVSEGKPSSAGEPAARVSKGLSFRDSHRHIKSAPLDVDPADPVTVEMIFSDTGEPPAGTDTSAPVALGGLRIGSNDGKGWSAAAVAVGEGIRGAATRAYPAEEGIHHAVAQWTGAELQMYWDGRRVGREVWTFGLSENRWATAEFLRETLLAATSSRLWLGGPGDSDFEGTIAEVRVSRGAKYDGDFPPPSSLGNDDETLLRYDFTRGPASIGDLNAVEDLSGNGHDGVVVIERPAG